MTYSSFPFENQNTDETQFSALFKELIDTGVCASSDATDLQIAASANNIATLQAGRAAVRGFMFINDAVSNISFDTVASGTRIDTVILRLDPAANSIVPVVVKGTSVAAPTLTQTTGAIWEMPLADVTVAASGALTVMDRRTFVGRHTGSWTTATRPSAPRRAQLGYNTTTKVWEWYDGAAWNSLVPADSGWISCVVNGSATGITCSIRKVGNQVFFRSKGSLTLSDYSLYTLCRIPEGFQPPAFVRHYVPRGPSANASGLFLYVFPDSADQIIQVGRVGADSGQVVDIWGSFSWLVD